MPIWERFLLALGLGVLGVVLWVPLTWVFDRSLPGQFLEGRIDPNPAHPGDVITSTWRLTETRACTGHSIREITDAQGNVWRFVEEQASLVIPQAEIQTLHRQTPLPLTIAPGIASYRVTLFLVCNPLQNIWPLRAYTPTLYFEVK